MRLTIRRRSFALLALLLAIAPTACVHVFSSLQPRTITLGADRVSSGGGAPRRFAYPLRAHLVDGRTVVFRDGALIAEGAITGDGREFALMEDGYSTRRSAVPLDSVVAVETIERKTLVGASLGLSATATGLLLVAAYQFMNASIGMR